MKVRTALVMLLALAAPDVAHADGDPIIETARRIEADLGARVGLSIHDTGSGERWDYRADGRFPIPRCRAGAWPASSTAWCASEVAQRRSSATMAPS